MRRLVVLLAGLAVMAAACSSADTGGAIKTAGSAAATTTAAPSCPAGSLPATVNDHGTAAASGAAITVSTGDSFFEPSCETRVPAGTVTVTVHNTGQALHNFSVSTQGIDQDVAQGGSITVSVKVAADLVQFFCKYHRTSGMVGALVSG
ncbi:MAG: cupredoxin domain-containing protein [Actinobacteria bacterium]|nr:cupredoxin domain-containing protein [Actinomycetota bacterium]